MSHFETSRKMELRKCQFDFMPLSCECPGRHVHAVAVWILEPLNLSQYLEMVGCWRFRTKFTLVAGQVMTWLLVRRRPRESLCNSVRQFESRYSWNWPTSSWGRFCNRLTHCWADLPIPPGRKIAMPCPWMDGSSFRGSMYSCNLNKSANLRHTQVTDCWPNISPLCFR